MAILSLTFFSGCEAYRCGEGVVVDQSKNLPLDSVFCKVTTGSQTIYTDSTGMFEVYNLFGGCLFGCKDIIIEFSKPGYKTIFKTNEEVRGTIYLEK